jgi:hypothetical protein
VVPPEEEPPPLAGSWGRLYALVVVYLFVLIAVFYAFTETFRPTR